MARSVAVRKPIGELTVGEKLERLIRFGESLQKTNGKQQEASD